MAEFSLEFVSKIEKEKDCYVHHHSHGCNEMVLYISGDGETDINGSVRPFKTGSVAFISAEKPHDERHFKESNLIYFGFSVEGDYILPFSDGVYDIKGFDRLLKLVEDILREVKLQKKGYRRMCSALISEYLVLFERGITESAPKSPSLDFCANFLRENFAINLDLKRFAEDNGYDYDRFRKLFKTQFGLAPKQFVIEQRLKKAYNLITETKETCTDIAYFCGFSDQAQFSKMFRRRFRYSPEEVRRQLKSDK